MNFTCCDKVSIITPLYNSERFLMATIESVVNQSYKNWEMIIVDDCSCDASMEIAHEMSRKDGRIRCVKLAENSGAAVARNKAIEMAEGRFVAFLDADDIWFPNKLERQISFMLDNDVSLSYSSYEKINECGDFLGVVGVPTKISYRELLKTCYIGCLTSIYDTKYFGKVFMPLIRKRQDFALWLSLLKRVDCAYGIKEPLAQYRVHSNSISSNKAKASVYTWRVYREVEQLPFYKCCYFFSHYAFRGLLRTKFPSVALFLKIMH